MTEPTRPPLWRLMRDSYMSTAAVGANEFYSAEIRAIAEELWNCACEDSYDIRDHEEVYDWLIAEANRAEAGE